MWTVDLQDYGIRRAAPLTFAALQEDHLLLAGTDVPPVLAGSDHPCFGDSGGPVFRGAGPMVVALNTATSPACDRPFAFTRLDTPAAQAFLVPFITPAVADVASAAPTGQGA
ncbi:MAG: hypothetical protein M3Q71_05495 [Chloroflexota bacterium]|nr:hypothetical protein [Chloroflexota bacterium]MDP9470110.1 hypothetical protein [Chloroflexota bacterium]